MTVPTQSPVSNHVGNGVTTSFPYGFKLLDAADITVSVDGVPKVLGIDYTVSGVGVEAGGSIAFIAAPAALTAIALVREVTINRVIDYQYQGDFEAVTVNNDFDRIVMMLQDSGLALTNTLRLPPGDPADGVLPGVAARALKGLAFDADGNPFLTSASGDANALAAQLASDSAATVGGGLVGFDAGNAYTPGTIGKGVQDAVSAAGTAQTAAAAANTNVNTFKVDVADVANTAKGTSLMGYKLAVTGSAGRTLADKLKEFVSIKDFGAVGNGVADDTAVIQAAINNLAALGPVTLFFPKGTYKISTAITTPTGAIVHLSGDGPNSTIIRQDSATLGAFIFDCNFAQAGSVRGMTIKGNSVTGTGSTGIGLDVDRCNDNFTVERVDISNFGTSMRARGCWGMYVRQFRFLHFQNHGMRITAGSSGNVGGDVQLSHGKISNNGFTGNNTASIAILSEASGGDFFADIDITVTNNGVVLRPVAPNNVLYNFFTNLLADTCIGNCWVLDSTNGKVWSIHMTNVWGSYSTNGSGLVSTGTQTDDVVIVNSRFRENGLNGVYLGTGGIRFNACAIASNSKLTTNTYDGVSVDVGVSDWSFNDCKIGNFTSSVVQGNGIAISAGASQNFQIIGCDLRNPGPGKSPIANGSTSANYLTRNNLPLQSAGVNRNSGGGIGLNSVGTIAAGLTRYIGAADALTNVGDAPYVTPRPGLVSQILVQVNAAPGGGQTFTYTLYVNGVASAMTGSIAGAATFQAVIQAPPVPVGAAQTLALQVVTSAGATVTQHRAVIQIDD